ncbi:MAG: aminotransferase class I/II-fold pyridoxal phosphate-dependent enzyme [Actinomycetia bacterium]|nr:aminotransferase class I/II-fold pyridoxal phosphate-dependent enzyme [Actinomycetes bacterium]MCP5035900.1 aminotransferase class I/II-fold pyridoxal phosphate-dependent enzyme [Actinomycetes bacterium]
MHYAHAGLRDPEYYVPGLPVDYVATRYGITSTEIAKLGSAENPHGPSPLARQAVADTLERLHLYPSWTADPLREKIADTYGYQPTEVICGAGETEIISLIIRAFCEPGGKILMPGPCFPLYHLFAEAEGRVPVLASQATNRTTMAVDVDAYVEAIDADTRIVFITNPHSPSGTWMTEADVRRIIEAAPQAVVVLDEAYVHYSQTPGYVHLAHDYEHVAVLRTFSKAFGLAGLRIGFGVAPRPIIDALLAIKTTWNMGQLQIIGAVAALDDHDHLDRTVSTIVESRSYVRDRFEELDRFRMVPDSRSNFFLIEILDPDIGSTRVFDGLLERGVIVKDGSVSFRGLDQSFLRCDASFKHHMDRLIDALGDLP